MSRIRKVPEADGDDRAETLDQAAVRLAKCGAQSLRGLVAALRSIGHRRRSTVLEKAARKALRKHSGLAAQDLLPDWWVDPPRRLAEAVFLAEAACRCIEDHGKHLRSLGQNGRDVLAAANELRCAVTWGMQEDGETQ